METIKKEKKTEWKQQYQKRKGYFKEYYQKNKETMDANNRKNAKKYREAYKSFREGKKSELEQRVELLEKVVKAICKGKQDNIHEGWVSNGDGDWKVHGLINDFEDAMGNLDFDYKD